MRCVADVTQRPVRLVVREEDLQQSRLTVLFRVLLALPHIVWLVLWSVAATVVSWVAWLTATVLGRLPLPLHRFFAAYIRYGAHVFGYLFVATRRYPGFLGRNGYELDVEIDPPERQRRLGVFFRLVLAWPAFILAFYIGAGAVLAPPYFLPFLIGLAVPLVGGLLYFAFLAWWSALVRGRMTSGLRDFTSYGIGYRAQYTSYALFLTPRYPDANPSLVEPPLTLTPHPVRLRLTGELRRSRLTVFFRVLLALPHFVWLTLWGVAAALAALVAYVVALVSGRVPLALHRFLAAYVRYTAHVTAYVTVVGGPFPGFVGPQGSYPVDIEIEPPERQHRLVTLFRVFLAIPAFLLAYPFGATLFLVAVGTWFYALVRGRAPEGLRNLGASIVRYFAQTNAYFLLVTSRYPHSSPALERTELPPPPPEPAPGVAV
jgi:Domain of unknown function (DUF4389)